MTPHNDVACVDEMCLVKCQGQQSFCDFEINNNARAVSGPIKCLIRATMGSGLSRRGTAS